MRSLKILKQHFDFTDDDLAANREGRLSERQRTLFQRELTSASIQSASVVIALFVVSLLTLIYFALLSIYGKLLGWLVCGAVAGWFALTIGVIWGVSKVTMRVLHGLFPDEKHGVYTVLGRANPQGRTALENGIVSRMAGQLRFQSDGEHEYIFLDDEEFMINVSAENDERLWELEEGQTYAIYFVPEVLWITAAEWLGDNVGEA